MGEWGSRQRWVFKGRGVLGRVNAYLRMKINKRCYKAFEIHLLKHPSILFRDLVMLIHLLAPRGYIRSRCRLSLVYYMVN